MTWTQAICENCWDERHPDRQAAVLLTADEETCSYCGKQTTSGIYVRDDPSTVAHPRVAS